MQNNFPPVSELGNNTSEINCRTSSNKRPIVAVTRYYPRMCEGIFRRSLSVNKRIDDRREPAVSYDHQDVRTMYVLFLMSLLNISGSNGINDDGTEYPGTTTKVPPFICTDGTELSLSRVCDGLPDCPDSSDELRKLCYHVVCPITNYRCSYGACVQKNARCDGFQDCVDGSDEFHCETTDLCTDREYRCSDSLECIPLNKTCDGYVNCADGSDEIEILCKDYPCPSHAFHCDYGGCVHRETMCDGIMDCVDGSDEETSICASINCHGVECTAYNCKEDEFSCESGGQCIPMTKLCDGSFQCRDASDEKSEICSSQQCNAGFFRCNYGGCIPESLKCNFQQNCHDWSDEDESTCGSSLPAGACRLPPAKAGTHYVVSDCPDCHPGQVVAELSRLDYSCDVAGSLEGSSSVYCQDNRWIPNLPTCASDAEDVTCPPIDGRGAVKRCEVLWGPRQGWITCEGSIPIGTRVTLECPDYYERETGSSHTTCLHDGTWSQLPLRCRPTCGVRETSAAALIIKGWELIPEEGLPWHATLFSHDDGTWNFFCGGSLIGERAVLTAGHCVWRTDEKTIRVVLAGYSSNFTVRDENTQVFEVDGLYLQRAYHDHEGNYGSDMAIIVLDRPARMNYAVKPVCLDWNNPLDVSRRSGEIGLVAGMGITENDTFSTRLRVTSVKLVSEDECRESQKRDFIKYITYTTFCAGWLNGTAVCNGDSGGGLFLKRPNSTIWDVHGVVSVSPRRIGTSICDPNYYTIFTKVSMYSDWISSILETLPIVGPPETSQLPNKDVIF